MARSYTRIDADFESAGERCAAWLYLPSGESRPPVVVMAHGFAAQRDFGLPAIAERFAAAGLAVLLFDYRNFGDSEGLPRNLVGPARHLADWRAALACVRGRRELDAGRIGLWGSSFSGGHAIVTAAVDGGVSALVAQVPFVDGFASARRVGLADAGRRAAAGLADLLRAALGKGRQYIAVVDEPGRTAFMNKSGYKQSYLKLVPAGSSWRNECPASAVFAAMFYRPVKFAPQVECPALIVAAVGDRIIPFGAVEACAARIKNAKLIGLEGDHFDVYFGDLFEQVVTLEQEFFERQLAPGGESD